MPFATIVWYFLQFFTATFLNEIAFFFNYDPSFLKSNRYCSLSAGHMTLCSIFSFYPHCSHPTCVFNVKPNLNKTFTTWCQEHLYSFLWLNQINNNKNMIISFIYYATISKFVDSSFPQCNVHTSVQCGCLAFTPLDSYLKLWELVHVQLKRVFQVKVALWT